MDASPETLVDFHTHSHYSDGVLSPAALVERARTRRVGTLALTDHDTTAGLAEARAACAASRDPLRARRRALGATGADKLFTSSACRSTSRMPDFNSHLDAVLAAAPGRASGKSASGSRNARDCRAASSPRRAAQATAPTRLHLARLLVERGHARDTQEAFDRWLNRDKAGHVPAEWPALAAAMAVLRDSGAIAVLAHPHRYRLSAGQLRELTAAFVQEGGAALEASMAGMSPNDADRIASLCRRFKLHASMGSDFHDPAVPWNPLGRWLKLAAGLEPVTHCLNV